MATDPGTLTLTLAPYGSDPATGRPYPPLPTQARVLDFVDRVRAGERVTDGIPVLFIQHGVNSGGTRGLLAPVLECLLEYPGIRMLWGRQDFVDLRLSGMQTFLEVLPPALLADKHEQEHRYTVRGPKGLGTLFFRELKDIRGLGSQEFALIVVQEAAELSKASFLTLKQRCRQRGFPNMILMEGNPPEEESWLEHACTPGHVEHDPDITRFILTSYENQAHMPPGYLASLERMDPFWRESFLLGQTGAIPDGTPVYPSFVPSVHVRETALIPDRPVIRGWDFGLRRAACVWGQKTDDGQLLWHREYLAVETPETDFIRQVLLRTNEVFGDRTVIDYGDPAATQRDPEGVSTLRRLSEHGIRLGWRTSTYGERIPLINRLLSELIPGTDRPRLVISPHCKILRRALQGGYRYPDFVAGQEFTTRKDVPKRDGWFEHIANAWEYPLVNLFVGPSDAQRTQRRAVRRQHHAQLERRQGVVSF